MMSQGNFDPAVGGGGQRPNIPNHLVKAILVTLFCCLPLGVVSIIFAAQVDGKVSSGDIAGAQNASNQANLFANIGLGIGLVGTIAYIALMVVAAVAGA